MNQVCRMLLVGSLLATGCQKELTESDVRISARSGLLVPDRPIPFPRPDTLLMPRFPRLPRPALPVLLNRCVYSYQDVVDALGTNTLQANSVILDGGALGDITLQRSENLPGIWYTAVDDPQGSSLFRSHLQVEWRPDPSVYFSGFSADVWSLGCVYENAAIGPYTNLIKDGIENLVNTCFFWGVGEYAHMRVKYLVFD